MATTTSITAATIAIEQKPTMNGTVNDNSPSPPAAPRGSIFSLKKTDTGMSDWDPADDSGVRTLGLHEWKEAALSLAESFKDDEVAKYFVDVPDRPHWTAKQKWERHVKIMEYLVYAHLLKGMVTSAGPDYDCVALWLQPNGDMDDWLTHYRSGGWKLSRMLSKEGRKRFFDEFFSLLFDTKAQVLGDRDRSSWYLVYIGTKPSGRGKGYARKVIEHVTKMADAEGRACYLESSHHVNRKIYAKMGFEMKKNIYLQRAEENVELDIMVREPVREENVKI